MLQRSVDWIKKLQDIFAIRKLPRARRSSRPISFEVLEDRQTPALTVPFSAADLALSQAPIQAQILIFINGTTQAPTISNPASTTFNVGAAGSFTFSTTGEPTATLTEAGALPSGVTFVDNGDGTATLAGTPAAGTGGTFQLTVTATNGIAPDATQNFTLTVSQAPTFLSPASVAFTPGTAGTFTVTTSGLPTAALSETGALPSGVTFLDNGDGTATLAGTPAAGTGGVYNLTLSATNGITPDASQSFTLTVNQAPAITSPANTTFTVGSAGTFIVSATGVPTPALTEAGTLPNGVTFVDNGNGTATLGGTPAVGAGGVYNFTITAANGATPDATQNYTLTVLEPPAFSSAASADFTVGFAGGFTVHTIGFPANTITEVGNLPSGVTFVDNGDGTATFSGTPDVGSDGTYNLTLTADNGNAPSATQNFTLNVHAPQAPAVTSANNTTFLAANPGNFTITTTGFPNASLSEVGALPSGVTFVDNGDGTATLAGTPIAGTGGTYTFTISASNSVSPDATQTFTLTVLETPNITSANNAAFQAGSAGTFAVTTAGFPAATSITATGGLPSGVTFTDNGNGTATLSGTPDVGSGGTYHVTLTATNGVTPIATQDFTLTVAEAPSFASADNTSFSAGSLGTFTVNVAGFPTPTIGTTGNLPTGVALTDNGDGTATLTGTPDQGSGGTYHFAITAANGTAPDATQNFTLTVLEAPAITSPTAAAFTVGAAGTFTITTVGFPANAITEVGDLPNGVTFLDNGDGTAALAGTPAVGSDGTYQLTITAANGITPDATQTLTLTVSN